VLIVEDIDLDAWIFTPAPWWAPAVEVYDNDLEYGWLRDRDNDVTQETQGFLDRFRRPRG
jgi:hypothetical protein